MYAEAFGGQEIKALNGELNGKLHFLMAAKMTVRAI